MEGTKGIPGAASLIAIAVVLAMAAFSSMCLATAETDRNVLYRMLDAEDAWHEADAEANLVLARIRAGEAPEGAVRDGDDWSYSVPVDGHRAIAVEAHVGPDGYEITSWRTVRTDEWTPDNHIEVYEGVE